MIIFKYTTFILTFQTFNVKLMLNVTKSFQPQQALRMLLNDELFQY